MAAGGDPVLPPSRFGTGYTTGAVMPPRVAALPIAAQLVPVVVPVSGPPPAAAAQAAPTRINVLAMTSLILVLLFGPFVAPFTLAGGFAARAQLARRSGHGTGLATAVIAVSCAYLALGLAAAALFLVGRA